MRTLILQASPREKITRHDVKARIEEFNALAGFQHVHKGMTSRDLTENVEQLQIVSSLKIIRDRMVATLVQLAQLATQYADQPIAGRTHNVAAQITTLGKRFATTANGCSCGVPADRGAARPLSVAARIKGPVGTSQDMLDLLGGDGATGWRSSSGGSLIIWALRIFGQHRSGLSPLARLRRGDRACSSCGGAFQPGDLDPADGRA